MAEAHEIGKLIGGFEVDNKLDFTGVSEESQFRTWCVFAGDLCSTVIDSILEGALCIAGLQTIVMPGSNWRQKYRRFLARMDRMTQELSGAFGEIASKAEGIKDSDGFLSSGLLACTGKDYGYLADKVFAIKEKAKADAAGYASSDDPVRDQMA